MQAEEIALRARSSSARGAKALLAAGDTPRRAGWVVHVRCDACWGRAWGTGEFEGAELGRVREAERHERAGCFAAESARAERHERAGHSDAEGAGEVRAGCRARWWRLRPSASAVGERAVRAREMRDEPVRAYVGELHALRCVCTSSHMCCCVS